MCYQDWVRYEEAIQWSRLLTVQLAASTEKMELLSGAQCDSHVDKLNTQKQQDLKQT